MANTMRKAVVGLAIGCSAATVSAAAAGEPLAPLTITVRLHNYAKVPPPDLARARGEAERIYRAIGVIVEWVENGGAVALVILPRDMTQRKCEAENIPDAALGRATADTRRAYAFYDRILRVARGLQADDRVLLGKVIAHELGHVLLGVGSHSPEGIMRPQLDTRARAERFTASQAKAIRLRSASLL